MLLSAYPDFIDLYLQTKEEEHDQCMHNTLTSSITREEDSAQDMPSSCNLHRQSLHGIRRGTK